MVDALADRTPPTEALAQDGREVGHCGIPGGHAWVCVKVRQWKCAELYVLVMETTIERHGLRCIIS